MWAVVPFSGPVPELISDLLGGAGTGDEALVLRLVGVLLGAALLASIALAWRHASNLQLARKNLEIAKIDTGLIGAALNSASGSFWAWPSESDTEEPGLFGPGLANLFGVSEDALKADGNIYENLDPDCRRQLRDYVANLRSNGAPFAMRVVTIDAKRTLEARGLRSSAKNTQADNRTWDTIWFRDVTGVVVEKNRMIDQAREMTVAISGYRHLFDGLNIPAWARGPDLSIVYCNYAYAHAVDQPTPEAAIAEGSEIAGGPRGWGNDRADAARAGGGGKNPVHLRCYGR
jgi:hypothetical protein